MPAPTNASQAHYDQMSANAAVQIMGKTGSAIVTTGVTWAASTSYPQVCLIQCLTDVVFSVLSGPVCWKDNGGTNRPPMYNLTGGALTAVTFPAGSYIGGNFTDITISSGTAIYYIS